MGTTPRTTQHNTTPRAPSPAERQAEEDRRREDRLVDAESEQSFPASDPPSWTLGSDKGPP